MIMWFRPWFSRFRRLARHDNLMALLALTGVLAFFYRDVVFGGHTFLMENSTFGTMPQGGPYGYPAPRPMFVPVADPEANGLVSEPYTRLLSSPEVSRVAPLWNPHGGVAGRPLLADGHTGPLDPLQFGLSLLPVRWWPVAVDAELLLRFLIGGFACYLFVKKLGIHPLGGIAAGAVFMLSSYFIKMGNHSEARVETLVPLVLLGYELAFSKPSRTSMVVCGLAVAWSIVAAWPESTFLALFLGGLWFCFRSIQKAVRSRFRWRKLRSYAIRYAMATGFGVGLAAPFWIPFLEFVTLSMNIHSQGISAVQVYPPWSAITALIPYLWPEPYMFETHYLGIGVVLLSLTLVMGGALQGNRRGYLWFFLIFATWFVLAAYGIPPFSLVNRVPVFRDIYLAKYSSPFIDFALAVVVGIALDRLMASGLSMRRSLLAAIVLVALIGILFRLAPTDTLGGRLPPRTRRVFVTQFGVALIPMAVILVAVCLSGSHPGRRRAAALAAVAILVIEPALWKRYLDRPLRYDPYTPPPFVTFLRGLETPYRILGLDNVLYPNVSSGFGIDDVRYLDALVVRRVHLYADKFIARNVDPLRVTAEYAKESTIHFGKYLDLLNVQYVLSGTPQAEWPNVRVDPTEARCMGFGEAPVGRFELIYLRRIYVYRNNCALPRAFVVGRAKVVGSLEDALDAMASPQFDPSALAVVEISDGRVPRDWQSLISPGTTSIARTTRQSAATLQIDATLSNPGLLIVTDTYYPGWKASVDGQDVPILIVDGMFRGLYLTAGHHEIEFSYEPLSFKAGVGVAALSAIALLACYIAMGRRTSAVHGEK